MGTRLRKKATSRTRTDDLFITNELLYQLSYRGLLNPRIIYTSTALDATRF